MIIDALTTNVGFKARCTMAATGAPSNNGFSWRVYLRLFNPITMTEVIHGFHDTGGAIQLPEDNWFFTMREIPEVRLDVNEKGEPS
jgi:hypothetical protein